uniref:Uncharacterized protein n=1 Tax=Candidatus Kentrum sp. FM TaxID=2126340 RepID=A0A450U2I0_9GAMM|nr:MAG: hypothetical protein BECKFM1743C_GA0114222_109673 [Candidatus Kentron sp. FM]
MPFVDKMAWTFLSSPKWRIRPITRWFTPNTRGPGHVPGAWGRAYLFVGGEVYRTKIKELAAPCRVE